MINLKGKHILITGASSGIGRETAILSAKLGAQITAVARRESHLAELIQELNTQNNENHQYIACDLSNEAEILEAINKMGDFDCIVHSAGMVYPHPAKYIRKKHLDKVMAVNFYAPAILNAALLGKQKINANGSIVFLSSISTKHPFTGGALYVSSKAALESYSRTLALELAHKKIRCNVVSPALVKTAIFEQTIETYTEEQVNEYERAYPFGFGEAIDVANTILFLLSNESRWITGQEIIMDGGLTLMNK